MRLCIWTTTQRIEENTPLTEPEVDATEHRPPRLPGLDLSPKLHGRVVVQEK
jgi:hypothetical protein